MCSPLRRAEIVRLTGCFREADGCQIEAQGLISHLLDYEQERGDGAVAAAMVAITMVAVVYTISIMTQQQ